MPNENLVFRLVDDSVGDPPCFFPLAGPTSMESVDLGQLSGEEQTCGSGSYDKNVNFIRGRHAAGIVVWGILEKRSSATGVAA